MSRLRETIDFGPGNFFRIERWSGDDRCVQIIHGRSEVERVPAFGARWHYHSAIELTSVLRGTSTCFVADRLQRFSAGELFVLGKNIPHYWHHPRGSEGLSILWEFPLGHEIWGLNEVKSLRLLAEWALRGWGIGGHSGRLACRHIEELADVTGLQRLGRLFQLWHDLLYAKSEDVRLVAAQPFDLTGINEQQEAVRRAQSYIHANFREPIALADLLRVTSMSRTTFSRQFLVHAGLCYTSYLNGVRLRAVCDELRSTSHAISTIALNNGFTQLSFFNRLFRREMGVCPKSYREAALTERVA